MLASKSMRRTCHWFETQKKKDGNLPSSRVLAHRQRESTFLFFAVFYR